MTTVPQLGEVPGSLTRDAFWELLGRVEHAQLDFKRGVATDVRDTIAAMAMTEGGLIVHGVDDRRCIVGCPLSQNTQDRITRIAMECGVDVQVRQVAVAAVRLTITAVPAVRRRIVTTPDGRLLRRVGGDSQPLRGDAMARFVREREQRTAEDQPVVVFDPSAYSIEAINEALRADGRPRVDAERIPRALADLQVAIPAPPPLDQRVLRAAVVLFARDPRGLLRGAAVQLVRRTGTGPRTGPTIERVECVGPLAAVVACCLEFIVRHSGGLEVVTGQRREALPAYPPTVVREAVVNALAHRDYGLAGATVDVTVWDDRVEVKSPGGLPGHVTVDNMREEHYSRNPRIMRVLKTLGYVEEYGEGVDRMFREMAARFMEPPVFEATAVSVAVTLRKRVLIDVEDQVWLSQLGTDELARNDAQILVLARREGAVTPRSLRTRIPGADVDALLARMVSKGLLRRVGVRGGSRYVLSEAIIARAGTGLPDDWQTHRQALLDEIRRLGSLSSAEGAVLIDRDVVYARALLNELAEVGLVRAEGRTRARRYYPD
ncbi:MAG: putative DNA binding domain-containing protein [Gammaproteobacteria bacterium]|nr:putative DNA binding domain-containing protein [Gammaproteobacteria bacterium]